MRTTGCTVLVLLLTAARPAAGGERDDALAVVERAVTAAGGEEKLAGLKAVEWTCKGTVHADVELTFTDRCFARWPEQFRHESAVEVRGQKYQRALILDGTRGWIKEDRGTVAMRDEAVAELRDKVYVLRLAATLLPLKEKGVELKPLPDKKIDGRAAVGVSATRTGWPDLSLYFDKDKSLLLLCERTVNDPFAGKVVEETFFSDYREAGGVQVARKVAVKRGGKAFLDWEVTDFQARAKLDKDLFGKP